jgi:glycosyltransferase involved in cell wall biosynthesis
MSKLKYIVITAARNEATYIENTIQSMVSQTILPLRWVIVDDGSTDKTPEIIARVAAKHEWIKLIRRRDRGFRKVGGGNVEALYEGMEAITDFDFDVLSVVDADLRFGPTYFASLLARFECLPQLGIAGGRVHDLVNGQLIRLRSRPEMTFGAIKCWRRDCFEDIGGIARHPGWDGLDCYKAMMNGWQTWTFEDESLRITHLRPIGSSQKSVYTGRIRRGRGLYIMGAHPLWALASALYHIMEPPRVVASLCVIYGYLKAWLQREPKSVDARTMRFIRGWQMRTLAQFWKPPWCSPGSAPFTNTSSHIVKSGQ